MRPYLLAAAVAATAAALPASAATPCTAQADAPYVYPDANVGASGSFGCYLPESGMKVTVCLETLQLGRKPLWQPAACETQAASTPVTSVSAWTVACVQGGPTLVRTAVTGWNAAGATASATSLPEWAPGVGSCGP